MTPKVSILVPVYNVSDFIEHCAISLFEQSLDDIEYVFVDDCTPDRSIEKLQKLLERYPERKNQVKIVHHRQNKGAAAARNTAFAASSGKYVLFIDGDDWIEPNAVELLYAKAEAEKADITICDLVLEDKNNAVLCPAFFSEDKTEIFLNLLKGNASDVSIVNKLINRRLYDLEKNIAAENLDVYEDRYAVFMLMYYADKISKVPKTLYHYIKTNPDSLTKQSDIHFKNFVQFWEMLDGFFKRINVYEQYINHIEYAKVKGKVSFIVNTNSYRLRKHYAGLFQNIEMQYFSHFRTGEKLILLFTHYKMYFAAQIVYALLALKNGKIIKH